MILLIDNYDSFSYNLYQLIGSINPDIKVIRNDEMTTEQIKEMNPDRIILSPGPGRPEDAGITVECVKALSSTCPILGVCLGHQAICISYGATVSYAKTLMHGKQSMIDIDADSPIFKACPKKALVARYHSLAAIEKTIPEELKIIARTDDGEVMAVESRKFNTFGLQFHPESIMTDIGKQILENFLNLTGGTK